MQYQWRGIGGGDKVVLWSLKAFKAPRPDGLHASFFQRFWLTVGNSLMNKVKKIFSDRKVPDYQNTTHIAPIPKIQGPDMLSNYRPINLCNTVYKVVLKIVVSRLRPYLDKLISLCQTVFVPGRKGIDNAIIMQEVIHTLSKKKGKVGIRCSRLILRRCMTNLSGVLYEICL